MPGAMSVHKIQQFPWSPLLFFQKNQANFFVPSSLKLHNLTDIIIGINWDRHAGFTEYPILTRVEGNTVHFEGGQQIDVDAIILCTGYRHCFPFVHPSLQMTPENVYYPKQLYKGVIYTKGGDNRMMYLGMQNQAFSFPMFDAQALWSLQYVLKNITVPCKADMLEHIKTWSQRY